MGASGQYNFAGVRCRTSAADDVWRSRPWMTPDRTFRTERDPLGEHGPAERTTASRRRARSRISRSAACAPRPTLVTATVLVKKAAARGQRRAGAARRAASPTPSSRAADEILGGALRDQFVVDVYQAGAGTSHNMNTNEVLANRAAELLGGSARRRTRWSIRTITSTWASRPTTCSRRRRASRCCSRIGGLVDAARGAGRPRSTRKAREFADVLKVGRTHLQDAVPMTLGQEFGGYARLHRARRRRCRAARPSSCRS